ncbi:DNA-binding protein RHL1-like [Primulina tabacum]|uniref:DNA-binding protein RHL1-like n=1 Tax=Primulina tabacum TaxID=48773 RepID=UPI003F5A358A
MARGGKKEGIAAAVDPITEERTRRKKLAFSRHILSQNPAKFGPSTALGPSKTVMKHHGKDILRKSQRKNRYLFSFPGLLGPISGGKIGELKDLGTKNPVLYLDFPQGQMKLFGTIVYPKNRYLTLQFSKGGKNVTCDDYFDNMIVFSDAWWIGTKDENPEELQLRFPNELNLEKPAEYDFKGGIGARCDGKSVSGKSAMQFLEPESPKVDVEDDSIESPTDVKKLMEVTPSRHSARTAGKTFNFAEGSSGEDVIANGNETSDEDEDEEKDIEAKRNYKSKTSLFTESSSPVVFDVDSNDAVKHDTDLYQKKRTAKSQDLSKTCRSSLVQTTLSTLFKKVEEKGRESNGPGDWKFASESSDPNDSSQDTDASNEDWTG